MNSKTNGYGTKLHLTRWFDTEVAFNLRPHEITHPLKYCSYPTPNCYSVSIDSSFTTVRFPPSYSSACLLSVRDGWRTMPPWFFQYSSISFLVIYDKLISVSTYTKINAFDPFSYFTHQNDMECNICFICLHIPHFSHLLHFSQTMYTGRKNKIMKCIKRQISTLRRKHRQDAEHFSRY